MKGEQKFKSLKYSYSQNQSQDLILSGIHFHHFINAPFVFKFLIEFIFSAYSQIILKLGSKERTPYVVLITVPIPVIIIGAQNVQIHLFHEWCLKKKKKVENVPVRVQSERGFCIRLGISAPDIGSLG